MSRRTSTRHTLNNSTICILGGTGFIGMHLIHAFEKKNNVNLSILSRHKEKLKPFSDKTHTVVGNLMDIDSLIYFLKPDATIINLAYLSTKSKDENLKAMQNLAEACVKIGVKRLIHCSTAVVAGRVNNDKITENTACHPITEYEKTKLEIEQLLINKLKDKIEIVIIRPTVVFGKDGKNLVKLADELINNSCIANIIKASIYSKRRMNLVCVENVIEAFKFLAGYSGAVSGQCYIISDDDEDENNYYDIVQLFSKHFRIKQISTFFFPFRYFILSSLLFVSQRTNINPKRNYSSEKLFKLGFKKSIPFKVGVQHFASWYYNHIFGDL